MARLLAGLCQDIAQCIRRDLSAREIRNYIFHNGGQKPNRKEVEEYCAIAIGKKLYLNGPVHLLLFSIFCQSPGDRGF